MRITQGLILVATVEAVLGVQFLLPCDLLGTGRRRRHGWEKCVWFLSDSCCSSWDTARRTLFPSGTCFLTLFSAMGTLSAPLRGDRAEQIKPQATGEYLKFIRCWYSTFSWEGEGLALDHLWVGVGSQVWAWATSWKPVVPRS